MKHGTKSHLRNLHIFHIKVRTLTLRRAAAQFGYRIKKTVPIYPRIISFIEQSRNSADGSSKK